MGQSFVYSGTFTPSQITPTGFEDVLRSTGRPSFTNSTGSLGRSISRYFQGSDVVSGTLGGTPIQSPSISSTSSYSEGVSTRPGYEDIPGFVDHNTTYGTLSTNIADANIESEGAAIGETIDTAVPAAESVLSGIGMAAGEAESVATGDVIPDLAPLIAGGAIISNQADKSRAASIMQGGSIANRMEAGNITAQSDNTTNGIISGTSMGSVFGPIGSLIGAALGGAISAATTHLNTMNTTSGSSVDPSNSAARIMS